ncbi:MAG: YcgN family cysteine cluster protein [Marinospirillum sp.]|uniref:YcgN family cysteine cluster protein n=1 Tax=Marinospirillum sp. TaxID=2183934 RepID=UPI0019E190CD|nr:YcgN family cysteine cluster protein [Marinospirillum sp.]MBE0506633.1 YcgN family cysteine cluster protein [Marinospirillum sp.]
MAAVVKPAQRKHFWLLPLEQLSDSEWEALCDGCGRCCLHKLQDEDDDQVYFTDVACKLLNLKTCRCRHYEDRLKYVPDCMSIREEGEAVYAMLPSTCAYRLRHENQGLPSWHPLLTGDQKAMRALGVSVAGQVVCETQLQDPDLEERIIHWIE